jgi:heme/copper-type cytochrome/quinol oxidase subunit 3
MNARGLDASDWEQEGPEQDQRIVALGARVLAAALCFFFGGFFFAFVYLRLQNVNDHWNHTDVRPSWPLGVVVLVSTMLAAMVLFTLRGQHRAHEMGSWRARGLAVLALILVAIVARVAQLWTLGSDPDTSGYVAVLIGWSAALVVVEIGAAYWIQTLVARARRLGHPEADASADRRELADAEARFHASASGFIVLWWVITAIEVVAFVLLDLVR